MSNLNRITYFVFANTKGSDKTARPRNDNEFSRKSKPQRKNSKKVSVMLTHD